MEKGSGLCLTVFPWRQFSVFCLTKVLMELQCQREKEETWDCTSLSTFTGEPQLPVANFLGYDTCTHNLCRLKFSVFQLGQPDLYILWGVFRSRTAGVLCVLRECKCFQWQPTRGRWFQGVKFE